MEDDHLWSCGFWLLALAWAFVTFSYLMYELVPCPVPCALWLFFVPLTAFVSFSFSLRLSLLFSPMIEVLRWQDLNKVGHRKQEAGSRK